MAAYSQEFIRRQIEAAKAGKFGEKSQQVLAKYEKLYDPKQDMRPVDMSKVTGVSGSPVSGIMEYTLSDGTKVQRAYDPNAVGAAISAVQSNAGIATPGTGTATSGIVPTTAQQFDIMGMIDQLNKAKANQLISNLEKAKAQALSSVAEREAGIKPRYYEATNTASATSQIGARNFAEYLAQRGGINSGVADEAEIRRQAALMGQIGSLKQQETMELDDIARQRADIMSSYEFDKANALAGLESAALEQRIAEIQRQRELALQQEQFAKQFGLQEAGVTGYYNPYANIQIPSDIASQIAQYSDNYQAEINRRMAINPNDPLIPYLQAARAQKIFQNPELLAKYGSEFMTASAKQQQFKNDLATKKLEESIRQFNIGQENWQRQFTYQQMQDKIQNALAAKRISLDQAQIALQQAKFKAEQDPMSLDNQYKRAQIEALQGKGGLTYKDYVSMGRDMLDKRYNIGDVLTPIYTPEQVKQWVLGLPLTPQEKVNLLNDLGIPK